MREPLTYPATDRLSLIAVVLILAATWALLCVVSAPAAPSYLLVNRLDPLTPAGLRAPTDR